MARMIPPVIHTGCASPGERLIFNSLKDDSSTSDWTVFHSLDLSRHPTKISSEIDFVVAVPGKGILCLEVKAAKKISRRDGQWFYGSDVKGHPESPFKQASTGMHQLRQQCQYHPDLKHLMFWSAVAFPFVDMKINSPEWHPWQVIDQSNLARQKISLVIINILDHAANYIQQVPSGKWFSEKSSRPTLEQIKLLIKILRGNFELFERPAARLQTLESELLKYTEEQFQALDAMERNDRIIFHGAAGTGKTVLALETARRAAAREQRTLFLCYNRNLAQWLGEQLTATNLTQWVTVSTIHKYMLEILQTAVPSSPTEEFWNVILPQQASDYLIDHPGNFDLLVIDELQDIGTKYLDILDLSVKEGIAHGKWRLFGDFENQTLYGGETTLSNIYKTLDTGVIYHLSINCRNTPRVTALVEVLRIMDHPYSKVLRPDNGIDPLMLFYKTDHEQTSLLRDVLQDFLNSGRLPEEIVILSATSTERAAAHLLINDPLWSTRTEPFTPSHKHIAFTTIKAFKGLEAPVIVVTDLRLDTAKDIPLLYTAVTRSVDQVVMLLSVDSKKALQKLILN